MFNPIVDNLTQFTDNELEERILDLSKKYSTAARLGKPELLTQISILVTMYKEERSKRYLEKKNQLDDDLDQLINVD
jgi:hypothetical protein